MKSRWLSAVVAGLAASVTMLPAHAIVGGVTDATGANSPWGGVGSVLVGGGGTFSGVMIAPGYVLTAQHVVGAMDAAQLSFQLNPGGGVDPAVLKVAQVFLASGFPGFGGGTSQIPANDLAILRLADAVPAGTPSYTIGGAPRIGDKLRIVGYGADATSQADPARRRVGSNRVENFLPTIDALGAQEPAGAYWFDFDTGRLALPNEGTVGGGDSGGPAFVLRNGVWELIGINTFSALSNAGLPIGGGGLSLDRYRTWIDGVIHPVPEPGSYRRWNPIQEDLHCRYSRRAQRRLRTQDGVGRSHESARSARSEWRWQQHIHISVPD